MGWKFYNSTGQLLVLQSSATADTATVATTVTVTDNESTNENNVLTFVAGADSDGGNVGLESDGNLYYNPSTGTLTATVLTGTVATATVGTTVTVTDNESTNENNLITFVADAGDSTGAHGLEMDGTLHYNPSTGLVTATTFAGALTGTAANVTTNANLTGHVTSSGNAAVLGSFTSAQLAGALSNETGSGLAVFATSPTLATPILGTPQSGDLSNCTGAGASLGLVIALS
jgi:Neuraminidase (sialidase)